jgi:hypothetical protein
LLIYLYYNGNIYMQNRASSGCFHDRKEVKMDAFDFLVSVIASVVAYYIYKWLDGR